MKRIKNNPEDATLQSYLGMLGHGDDFRLTQEIRLLAWMRGYGDWTIITWPFFTSILPFTVNPAACLWPPPPNALQK
ncbi:MAG: hypothetical protein AAB490_04085, partial [Patescibacteria group bacterium]